MTRTKFRSTALPLLAASAVALLLAGCHVHGHRAAHHYGKHHYGKHYDGPGPGYYKNKHRRKHRRHDNH